MPPFLSTSKALCSLASRKSGVSQLIRSSKSSWKLDGCRCITTAITGHHIQPSLILFSFSTLSLPVKITLHSSLGFISVLAQKVPVGLLAICLANWPTYTSKFLIANSVLFWCDIVTCMSCTNISSSLVVFSYRLGSWLGGWWDGPPWLKLFPGWDLQPWP